MRPSLGKASIGIAESGALLKVKSLACQAYRNRTMSDSEKIGPTLRSNPGAAYNA